MTRLAFGHPAVPSVPYVDVDREFSRYMNKNKIAKTHYPYSIYTNITLTTNSIKQNYMIMPISILTSNLVHLWVLFLMILIF